MANWARFIAAAALGTISIAATICAESARPRVAVMLRNDANVPEQTVQAAQQSVNAVYDAAGVEISWSGRPARVIVALITRERARLIGHRADVIGFANLGRNRQGKVAYIFVHRVNELSRRYGVDASVILGAVIAHEVGHLLMPWESHSDGGLMRALLDGQDFRKADRGELLFTAEQAVQIRSASLSR